MKSIHASKRDHEALKQEHEALKQEHEKLKKEVDILQRRDTEMFAHISTTIDSLRKDVEYLREKDKKSITKQ